jgi:hypothetical protein
MLFKVVKYTEDEMTPNVVPEVPSFVEAETAHEARILAKRVFGCEHPEDVTLSQFIGQLPSNAKVYSYHMTFEEMFGVGHEGLATAL